MEDNFYDGDYYERHNYGNGGHWSLQRVALRFVDGRGRTLQRCDFSVNPSSMQYNYPVRNVFIKTLGARPAMQGYGADIHTIQISGQTGYHKTAIMSEGATGPDTNYGQAKKLKKILVDSIRQAHDDYEEDGVGNHANSQLWFMNYTDGACYQVELEPQGVQFSRTNNDPMTYYYTITMAVIRSLQDPLPSQMTTVNLGNVHNLFPTIENVYENNTYNVANNILPFNRLYNHPVKQSNPAKAFKHGRKSIIDPTPKKHIKSLENKSDAFGNPNTLSIPQTAKILSSIDKQNDISHTIDLGPVKAKIDSSTPKDEIIYWTKWLEGNNNLSKIKPVKVSNSANKPNIPYHQPAQSKPISVLPSFVSVTDGNAVHVLVPTDNFEQIAPQKGVISHNKDYYNKRFFKNTKTDDDNAPLSNLVNGDLTVSEVVNNTEGDLTVEPVSPHTKVNAYQEELTTITDQNKAFIIQPNQFEPNTDTPVNPPSTGISSDYAQFYRANNQLIMSVNGKTYTNVNNYFVLSDLDNQMEINTEIDPQADNWLVVSLKAGNVYIKPSGPQVDNDNSYYLHGVTGSHTVFGNSFMIVPNSNNQNTVFDNMSHTEAYSANTDTGNQVHYGLDKNDNIRLENVNGDTIPFNVDDTPVSAKPKLNIGMKYKTTRINPDIIQGQSYKQTIKTPKEDDNQ